MQVGKRTWQRLKVYKKGSCQTRGDMPRVRVLCSLDYSFHPKMRPKVILKYFGEGVDMKIYFHSRPGVIVDLLLRRARLE